jgi:phosphoglycerol transferase MdoB-like AlkP superfamily enzyme
LVGDFVVCALEFIPAVAQWSNTFVVFLPLVVFALFLLLGIALLVLTVRGKVAGLLRKFLILTGAASIVIPVSFAVLEALPPQIANIIFYIILMAFLVGVVGSIVLARRQRKQATHPS